MMRSSSVCEIYSFIVLFTYNLCVSEAFASKEFFQHLSSYGNNIIIPNDAISPVVEKNILSSGVGYNMKYLVRESSFAWKLGSSIKGSEGVEKDALKNNEEEYANIKPLEHDTSVKIELWLDLRDTAILPSAALCHILEDDFLCDEFSTILSSGADEDKVFFIDKVLTSDQNYPTNSNDNDGSNTSKSLSSSFNNWATQHMEEEFESLIEILYEKRQLQTLTKHNLIYSATSGSEQQQQESGEKNIGISVELEHNVIIDPIPCLESVSRGLWVVVGADGIAEYKDRNVAINSLVELISSSSSFSSMLLSSNGDSILNFSSDDVDNVDSSHGMGGVAISCKNKSDIVNAGACIELMSSMNKKKFKTTESGILIQDSDDDNIFGGDQIIQSVKFAVLLPFDIEAWRAASFIFGGYSKYESEDQI